MLRLEGIRSGSTCGGRQPSSTRRQQLRANAAIQAMARATRLRQIRVCCPARIAKASKRGVSTRSLQTMSKRPAPSGEIAESRVGADGSHPIIPAPDKIPVTLIVNGVETQLEVAPWTTLARRAARPSRPDRHQEGLRSRPMRRLHGAGRRAAGQFLPDARGHEGRRRGHHDRGPGDGRRAASAAAGVHRP